MSKKSNASEVKKVYFGCDKEEYSAELIEMIRMFTGYVDIFSIKEKEIQDNSGIIKPCPSYELVIYINSSDGNVSINGSWDNDEYQISMFSFMFLEGKSSAIHEINYGDGLDEKRKEKWIYKLALFMFLKDKFDNEMKWGALMGVRPSKLYRQFREMLGAEKVDALFSGELQVSEQKHKLIKNVYDVQEPIISSIIQPSFDLYIGIPFCRTRCNYCSFAAYPMIGKGAVDSELVENYVETLVQDIGANLAPIIAGGNELRAVYFGGGTPTAISAGQLEKIISAVEKACGGLGVECTVEAGRPDTIDSEKLAIIREFDIDRISINPQTMNDKTLEYIGRDHISAQIIEAFSMARDAGFRCINMDIIMGLEDEKLAEFEYTLREIKKLDPENLTVHSLAVKRASKLREQMLGNERSAMSEMLAKSSLIMQMQELSREYAEELNMHAYYLYRQKYAGANIENVGYSKAGFESIYNIDIMEEVQNILALGAGAISKRISRAGKIQRLPNNKDLRSYIDSVDKMREKRIALWEIQ